MRTRQRRRAFTLLEILAGVLILSIIASMAIVGLQGYQDRVAMMVDDTNLKCHAIAVKMNAIDTGSIAGSLSELRPIDFERAYAQVLAEGRPYTMLAYLSERWQEFWGVPMASAEPYVPCKYYNCDPKVLHCSKDNRPGLPTFSAAGQPSGNVSYAISKKFRRKSVSFLTDPRNESKPLLFESNDGKHEVLRHENGKMGVRITPAGKHLRKKGNEGDSGDDDPSGDDE